MQKFDGWNWETASVETNFKDFQIIGNTCASKDYIYSTAGYSRAYRFSLSTYQVEDIYHFN